MAGLTISCESSRPEDTRSLGRQLGIVAQPGDVFLLVGELGAGKTVFTQGLGEGMGIREPINSPTFVLLREYQGRLTLYHYDLYRLANVESTVTREWEEFLYGQGVSAVEWANRASELLPADCLLLEFLIESDTRRVLKLTASGERHVALLSSLHCS